MGSPNSNLNSDTDPNSNPNPTSTFKVEKADREAIAFHERSVKKKFAMAFFIATPFMVIGMLPYLVHMGVIEAFDVYVAVILYTITGLGITVMYHRYLTHRSFALPKWAETIGLACAALALESGPTSWVATHTKHHATSDEEDDPHSPHKFGQGLVNMLKGFLWAHFGWIIKGVDIEAKYILPHMKSNPTVHFFDRTFPVWAILSYVIPTALGWLHRGLDGAIAGLLIGGVLRIFFVHHVTWCVNSLGHMIGDKPFKTIKKDQSRNLPLVSPMREWINPFVLILSAMGIMLAIMSFGELYHAGHHALASSAKHAIGYRFHVDISWYVIQGLKAVGIASEVQVPSDSQVTHLLIPK